MRRAARLTTLATVTIVLLVASGPPRVAAVQGVPAQRADDFPDMDSSIWGLQRRGLAIQAANRGLAETPLEPATLDLVFEIMAWYDAYDYADAVLDSLRRLAAGDADEVELAARHLANTYAIQRDESRDRVADIEALAAAVRARLPELPREQAARVVRMLIPLENRLAGGRSSQSRPMVRRFVEEYAGTEAALLAEVEVIGYARDPEAELEPLDAFIRRHPGTCAAAAALYAKADNAGSAPRRRRGEPRESDPTGRFLQMLALVEELESGDWPDCPSVDRSFQLIAGFYVGETAEFGPGNLARMLDAQQRFVIAHAPRLGRTETYGSSLGSLLTHRMAALYERQGNRVGGVEATFAALAPHVNDPDMLDFMRAEFYINEAHGENPDDRPALIRKAIDILEALSEDGSDRYARKGLATLAALRFYERDFEPAVAAYHEYLSRWPGSDWAWVARMRIGQAQENLGDWEAALSSYRQAARDYAELPPALVLASVFAARASETLGEFGDALDHYAAAVAGWDDDFGARYSLETRHAPAESGGREVWVSDYIARADLTERVVTLSESSRFAEGILLESGRRLMAQGRWQDARAVLEGVASGAPSPLMAEASYLAHRARFEHALELADIDTEESNETAAYDELDALSNEPWDPAVGAATLARAAIIGKAGREGLATTQTREALQQWLANQQGHFSRARPAAGTDEALYDDVVAIRNAVFHPLGGDFYVRDRGRWNAFDWPAVLPEFLIANPDLAIVMADSSHLRIRVLEPVPELDNVLFMSEEHLGFLKSILSRLGGTATRPPRAIMETPNQPIGPAVDILAMWKELFPGRPGHWSGWDLKSYPVISRIEFRDEERTEAAASVTIGYSGCKVVLERRDGTWVVTRLSDFWIT